MSIAIIGANGQLGSDLSEVFGSGNGQLIRLTRSDFDLRDHKLVADELDSLRPDVIINTAAFHKVEACEDDPEAALAVNCLAVRNLAMTAQRIGACLVHISTDYVFDGRASAPYKEDAQPNPVNTYGLSKLAGEFFVRNWCADHLLIRTSGLYGVAGSSGKGGNFVQTMLRLGREKGSVSVVNDQTLSPTFTADLAKMIRLLVERNARGLFHVTNSLHCSWFEFARAIFSTSGLDVETRPITTASQGSSVRRPRFSVLANAKLIELGIRQLRPWQDALEDYLTRAVQVEARPTASGLLGVKSASK